MIIPHDTAIYSVLKWGYQPIKLFVNLYQELLEIPRRKSKIYNYFAREGFKGLHVGCGPVYYSDWLNTDTFYGKNPKIDFRLDITNQLPFYSNTLDAVYGEEVIEHISRESMRKFIREVYRILRPGGIFRFTTPDVTEVYRLFLELREDVTVEDYRAGWLDGEFSKEIWINAIFRSWGHQFIWSFDSLQNELIQVGFSDVWQNEPRKTQSNIAQLTNLEQRHKKYHDCQTLPPQVYAFTLIVEAQKSM